VSFKFEYTSGGGNNIYIDDINLTGVTSVRDLTKAAFDFIVYPNPLETSSVVKFTLLRSEEVNIVITDMLGREISSVFEGMLRAGTHEYKLGGLESSGVFILKSVIGSEIITERIIVE
jgi:hypothetical protein